MQSIQKKNWGKPLKNRKQKKWTKAIENKFKFWYVSAESDDLDERTYDIEFKSAKKVRFKDDLSNSSESKESAESMLSLFEQV